MGIKRLRESGVEVALVTAENSPIVLSRARKLDLDHVYVGIQDKAAHVASLVSAMGLSWEEVGFIGDDLNDLQVMQAVGLAACPADAQLPVRSAANHVSSLPGGHGAVREICDLILRARGAIPAG
jgi:N-acylneuraminate cytidylyltransferase